MPSEILSFKSALAIGTTLAAVNPAVVNSAGYRNFAPIFSAAPTETVALASTNAPSTAYKTTLQLHRHVEIAWTKSKERAFTDLVTLKALGNASSEDLLELEKQKKIRRIAKNPQSPKEMIFQFKRQQLAAKLAQNIAELVALEHAARSS